MRRRKKRTNGGSEVPPARQMLAANQRNQLTGAVEAAAKTAERCADAAHQRDIAVVATAAQKELDKLDKELRRAPRSARPRRQTGRAATRASPPACTQATSPYFSSAKKNAFGPRYRGDS